MKKSKVKSKNKKDKHLIDLSLETFKTKLVPFPALKKAAKGAIRDLRKHFNAKKGDGGWDLDYGLIVSDIFYEAYGHHLENYLLNALAHSNLRLMLIIGKDGQLVIRKSK